MTTFTSTLPDSLLKQLHLYSKKLKLPKNKLIEKALQVYLDQLERAEYIRSFRQYKNDTDITNMAEEGMIEYLQQIQDTDETS
ncbi:MAG TPA: ribbon-helix-helix domain-containing protein [Lutibacter sp.]|nr:ribbon-helix-helix domain-containing protein [Lutibacter sp.]